MAVAGGWAPSGEGSHPSAGAKFQVNDELAQDLCCTTLHKVGLIMQQNKNEK